MEIEINIRMGHKPLNRRRAIGAMAFTDALNKVSKTTDREFNLIVSEWQEAGSSDWCCKICVEGKVKDAQGRPQGVVKRSISGKVKESAGKEGAKEKVMAMFIETKQLEAADIQMFLNRLEQEYAQARCLIEDQKRARLGHG